MSRIALVGSLNEWGGLERLYVAMANEFIARGHAVEIVCIRRGRTPYPAELHPAAEVTVLPTRSKLSAARHLRRWLATSRPDAVMTVKDHAAQACVLARMFSSHKPRLVVVVSNTLSYVARRRLQRMLIPRLYPRADRIAALSEGVVADLETAFGMSRERIDVIHQPVVPADLDERMAAAVEHPWLAADAEWPAFLGAGRLAGQKNFELLISAFARVRSRRPARLVIVGEGNERTQLEAHAQTLGVADDVDLYGAVPDPLPYMARASVFVLSSRYEGFANVVAEALATGRPVVASDCPSGPREILQDGRYGWLVPPGDDEALADAMEQALETHRVPPPAEASNKFRPGYVAEQYLRALGIAD